jgi:hypothetical protein
MNVLLIDNWIHPKNLYALSLYKNIRFHTISASQLDSTDLTKYDGVYSPSEQFDISKYPRIKWVFGPHFSVFPNEKLYGIRSERSSYIVLSDWNKKIWEKFEICNGIKLVDIPFAVDTERFCEITPIHSRDKVFIYYKSRHPSELQYLETVLTANKIEYKIFHYMKRYDETEYLTYLQQAKFGIWLGRHESQGFALEEALSCNVPLLVWDVSSMNQEIGQNYKNIPATVIPYWDERCGEYFYKHEEFVEKMRLFLSKLYTYRPRDYVLEHLSPEICENRFVKLFQ